ncbi:hypothetical protein MMC12_008139 [Toensbergia leucococca]|nr:hypothetical protein [Toensbergia leucococca]
MDDFLQIVPDGKLLDLIGGTPRWPTQSAELKKYGFRIDHQKDFADDDGIDQAVCRPKIGSEVDWEAAAGKSNLQALHKSQAATAQIYIEAKSDLTVVTAARMKVGFFDSHAPVGNPLIKVYFHRE